MPTELMSDDEWIERFQKREERMRVIPATFTEHTDVKDAG
jgi:hypothetical protein